MKHLTLKVSRETGMQLFKIRQRIKHGKGKLASKTNSLLYAHYSAIPLVLSNATKVNGKKLGNSQSSTIRTFIDKKAGLCEQYELYQNIRDYKSQNNIGLQFVDGILMSAPKKRQLQPKMELFGITTLQFEDINTQSIQKIVKQWLAMHTTLLPKNKVEYRAMVNDKNDIRLKKWREKLNTFDKPKKCFAYKDELIYKGTFRIGITDGIESAKQYKSFDSLKIVGMDKQGNFIVDKHTLNVLTHYLQSNGNVETII